MYVYCRDVSVVLLWFPQGPIHSIADLEPLCGMCQENVCSVTLKPCDHMMCSGLLSVLLVLLVNCLAYCFQCVLILTFLYVACALLMKRCFECKTKITSKIGLDEGKYID